MASSIILTANTQQAVAELQKLDAAQRQVGQSLKKVADEGDDTGSFWDSTTAKIGAAAVAIGGAVAGIVAWANAGHQAAVEASGTADQLSGVNYMGLQAVMKSIGGIIDMNAVLHAQNVLMEGDLKLTEYQLSVLAKTAASWADQTGQAEGEVLIKLSNAIATGSKLEKLLAQHGISVKLTGDKAKDTAIVMDLLAEKFGNANIQAANAGERLTAYNNEMKMLNAYVLGGDRIGIGETISMGWKKAVDSVTLFLATGKSVATLRAEMEREFQTKAIVKSINDITQSLKDYSKEYDRLQGIKSELESGSAGYGTKEQAALQTSAVAAEYQWLQKFEDELPARLSSIEASKQGLRKALLETIGDESMAAEGLDKLYEYAGRLAEQGLLKGFDLARFKAVQDGYREIMYAERRIIVESRKAKTERVQIVRDEANRIQAEREKAASVLSAWSQAVTTAVVASWATANKMTMGLANAVALQIKAAITTPKPDTKVDSELVKLTKDVKQAELALQAAKTAGDVEAAKSAQEKLVSARQLLEAYKKGGESALFFTEKLIASEKNMIDARNKNREEEIKANEKQHQLARARYAREIQDQQELFDLRYKDVQAQGAAGVEVERIDKLREQAQIRYARELRNGHTVTAGVYAAEIKDLVSQKAAIMENVAWQRELKRTLDERAAVLPYLSLAGESPIAADLKQKEFDLSVALLKNDKDRAEALKAQIVEMKGQANAYGELQNRFNSWGQGWELTKKLTESVFRSSTEALLMSNAELKKAGKTRSQMIMESLKNTLKAAAIDNAVKGGTRLAEAIAATAIGNPSAAGLYAASAKHFAVALAAGGAAALARVQGGGNAPTAKTEKTSSVAGTAAANSQINYVYNFSNSMMLSNPDALVRSFKGLEKSYAERKAS